MQCLVIEQIYAILVETGNSRMDTHGGERNCLMMASDVVFQAAIKLLQESRIEGRYINVSP